MGAVLAMKVFFYMAVLGLLVGCQPIVQRLSGGAAPAPAALSPEASAGPRMLVQIPARGATAVLFRVAVNKDVATWLTADNISLSFRQGVLVASRGLGFDLMTADAQGTLDAIAGQGKAVYRRQMRYLTGEHHTTYLTAGCSMNATGTVVLDGQRLRRFEEHCKAGQNVFTNVFGLNAAGTVIRSQQWVSPEIGYLSNGIGQK